MTRQPGPRRPEMLERRDHTMRWEREADTQRLVIATEGIHRLELTAGLATEPMLVRLSVTEEPEGAHRRMVDVTLWPHEVRVLMDWLESLR